MAEIYKILIVDDEPLARQRLKRLVETETSYEVVGELAHGRELGDAISAFNVDICLLDIHLPGLSGLQLAKQLQQLPKPPVIIFCTAYNEYALEAFDYQAVDYIVKPVRQERLSAALARASVMCVGEPQQEAIIIHQANDVVAVPWDEVRCLLAEDKYVTVVTATQQYLTTTSLKQFEEQQPQRLLRVHRNALVVKNYVIALRQQDKEHQLQLMGIETTVTVSRRHLPAVRQCIKDKAGAVP